MNDSNRQPRPSPLSSIGSWATKTFRVKQQPTTVIETGDASAAIAGLTSVAAVCVLAAVLWRRLFR
jgi:hypothetical protein